MSGEASGIRGWLKTRFPFDRDSMLLRLQEPVPNHLKRWWWCLGGMPAYLFLVQAVTGILLVFYYVPDPARAYESVGRITNEIPFGWWVRSVHRWSANLMIITVVLHMMRVYFTGAYRKPRELNWIFGAALLFTTLFFGFTGYSLVYDEPAYWGATVAANLTESVPLVGKPLARFIRGGDTVGPNTLTRFFVFHIGILPTLTTIFLALHILMVRTHGVTEMHFRDEAPDEQKSFRFYPDHILTELIIGLGLLIAISAVTVIFPPGLGGKADPLATPAHIKPEWYFFFTFRWLKLVGLTPAVITLGAAMTTFLFWPLAESALRRAIRKDISIPLGVVAVLAVLALTVWEALTH